MTEINGIPEEVTEEKTYRFEAGRPKIKVYTSINSRFILEDFIAKLEPVYGTR